MKFELKWFRRSFSTFLAVLTFAISVGLVSPSPAIASTDLHPSRTEQIREILSDKKLIQKANKFLSASPEKVCSAYLDADSTAWSTLAKSADAAFVVTNAVTAAATAGAGTLTGYAGIAAAVSHLGLGGLTTAVAGFMGSHAVGAAATSVVTAAVGGPIVMGTLLVGGTGAVAFGTYKLGKVAAGKLGLGDWAEKHCSEMSPKAVLLASP